MAMLDEGHLTCFNTRERTLPRSVHQRLWHDAERRAHRKLRQAGVEPLLQEVAPFFADVPVSDFQGSRKLPESVVVTDTRDDEIVMRSSCPVQADTVISRPRAVLRASDGTADGDGCGAWALSNGRDSLARCELRHLYPATARAAGKPLGTRGAGAGLPAFASIP